MSYTLLLNSSNVIGSNNNTYQYKLISGSFHAKDCEMAVGFLAIPYSWSNISTGLPNLPVNCVIYSNNSNDAIYAGTDVGVYYRDGTGTV